MSRGAKQRPSANGLGSPHRGLKPSGPREKFTVELLDRLWQRYRRRVSYVRDYEQVVESAGATFHNDHIAFRTIARQRPAAGAASLSRIVEALGYQAAGCYRFPDKHLGAVHFDHPSPGFPKLFISELKTWELPAAAQRILLRCLKDSRPALPDRALAALYNVAKLTAAQRSKLLATVARQFEQLPWPAPAKKDVLAVNETSQYGAWVLVHGYNVNHFTALVNSHGRGKLDTIDKTVAALLKAGVPMKDRIEGARGSKLRQTATDAVMIQTTVTKRGKKTRMPWTYAYLEIAERGMVADAESGRPTRFEGFLGPQATQLFEMTKLGGKRK